MSESFNQNNVQTKPRRKRNISDEQRQEMSKRMKDMWNEIRKKKGPPESQKVAPVKQQPTRAPVKPSTVQLAKEFLEWKKQKLAAENSRSKTKKTTAKQPPKEEDPYAALLSTRF